MRSTSHTCERQNRGTAILQGNALKSLCGEVFQQKKTEKFSVERPKCIHTVGAEKPHSRKHAKQLPGPWVFWTDMRQGPTSGQSPSLSADDAKNPPKRYSSLKRHSNRQTNERASERGFMCAALLSGRFLLLQICQFM